MNRRDAESPKKGDVFQSRSGNRWRVARVSEDGRRVYVERAARSDSDRELAWAPSNLRGMRLVEEGKGQLSLFGRDPARRRRKKTKRSRDMSLFGRAKHHLKKHLEQQRQSWEASSDEAASRRYPAFDQLGYDIAAARLKGDGAEFSRLTAEMRRKLAALPPSSRTVAQRAAHYGSKEARSHHVHRKTGQLATREEIQWSRARDPRRAGRKKSSNSKRKPRRSHAKKTQPRCLRAVVVQTLRFAKRVFTRRQAVAWAKEHGFRHAKVDVTKTEYRLRQVPPSSVRVVGSRPMRSGLVAVYGCPKARKGRRAR